MINKKVVSTVLTTILVISTFSAICTPASAATEEEIEQAIAKGTAWLAAQQNPDGSWGAWYCDVNTSYTGLALIKLQDRAYELGYESPFDPGYEYSENVIKGWKFIFSTDASGTPLYVMNQTPLSKQTHGVNIDDPDTNGNGYGVYFAGCYGTVPVYTTGIVLQALKASGTPNRPNDGGIDFDGDGNADTFQEMAQDAVEWMAFAQGDSGNDEGGWGYGPLDNQGDDPNNPNTPPGTFGTDNSNGGYAVLGLAAGEGFGCTVPAWVRTELNIWIGTIQDPVNGDVDDGGSYYNPDWVPPPMNNSWCNELKAGNLIFQMTFYGDDPTVQRFKDAMDYIERHWNDQNFDPGWKGDYGVDDDGDTFIDEDPWDGSDNDGDTFIDEDPGISNYQAIYCLMKGFEYSGIDLIDLDGDNVPEHDWYEEFTTALVKQQHPAGYWSMMGYYGSEEIDTAWALLTLEKITPPPPVITVYVDIKPGSCPNPLNLGSKGVLPVAVLGTADFDVTTIDPATIKLTKEGVEEGVTPLRWNYEDVATPFEGELCDCHDLNGDGYMDLSLKFDTQAVVTTLELDASTGETIPLTITGNLKEEAGGTSIEGQDCIWVLKTDKK